MHPRYFVLAPGSWHLRPHALVRTPWTRQQARNWWMPFTKQPNAEPIPGYRLIAPLGCGGFGEVWKCEAPGGMFKAIKFVYGNMESVDLDGIRAEQEKKALERIREVRHPFVCSLERWEFVEGELIIVMELAERTLHDQFLECQNAGLIGIP